MSLQNYFKKFSSSEVQIVGPFFDVDNQNLLKDPIIYVDAGVHFRTQAQGFSVGDGDSSEIAMDEKLNTKKSYSDLAFVLQHIPRQFSKIQLLGFLGHRKDHELINFAEVHKFLKKSFNTVQIHFDKKIKVLSKGTWDLVIHGSFSIFAFEEIDLQVSGDCDCQVLAGEVFSALSSQGLSNQGYGEVKIICNQPLFIFLNPK